MLIMVGIRYRNYAHYNVYRNCPLIYGIATIFIC